MSPEAGTDRHIGDLAVQLGHESMVARLQYRCVVQAVESATADLAVAKTCLANALARVERCQDGLAEARRMLGRRVSTQGRISQLVAALVAACSEPQAPLAGLQAANAEANEPLYSVDRLSE